MLLLLLLMMMMLLVVLLLLLVLLLHCVILSGVVGHLSSGSLRLLLRLLLLRIGQIAGRSRNRHPQRYLVVLHLLLLHLLLDHDGRNVFPGR